MKTGSHKISMAEYLALPYLSSGLCHTLITSSPYHAKFEQDFRVQDDTEASDVGTAIHDALLEGMDRIVACPFDDWRKNIAKEMRDSIRAAGNIPMLERKVAQITTAVNAAKKFVANSELAGLFDSGEPEQTIIWQEDGITLKARPDWWSAAAGIMCHVKTTQASAQPESWIRNQLITSGYDVAWAFYNRAPIGNAPFTGQAIFLVIEQNPPHGCSLVGLSPSMEEIANGKVDRAIRLWAQCQKSGHWHAYPSKICYAEPTNWQMSEHETSTLLSDQELSGGIPA